MSSYRSRLSTLEVEVNQEKSTIWMKVDRIKYYLIINLVLLIILFIFPPSFVYIMKKKKKTQRINWLKWIGVWIISSLLLCYMYYKFIPK